MMEVKKRKKRIPYGIVNFADIRRDYCYYVDKTSYIERVEDANKYFFFIRPRRFGKSSLLSMLEHYYDINKKEQFEELFGDLYIGKHPTEERNSYLIIHLNFSMISGNVNNYREALDEHCRIEFEHFCKKYASLLPKESMENLMAAKSAVDKLQVISACCEQAGQQIYLFIDEYDHFTNDILSSDENLTSYEAETHREGYLRQFFSAIKGCTSSSIRRCFITGVSPVTMDDVTSGFNIATNYSSAALFNGMVGFSETEVRELLDYYATTCTFHHTTDELIERIKPWYDNYCFSEVCYATEPTMYNSNMVLYFVDNYIHSGGHFPKQMLDVNIRTDYSKLHMLIRKDKEFANDASVIQRIVEQGYIVGNVADSFRARSITDPNNFISLLYYFGMLTFGGSFEGKQKLVIPNEVVKEQIYRYLLDTYQEVNLTQDDSLRNELSSALAYRGEWKPYFDYIADCLHRFAATRDVQKGEAFVHGFSLAMTSLNAFFRPISETDSGQGYADIFLRPNLDIYADIKHSYIIEYKYVKRSEPKAMVESRRQEAIQQALTYANADQLQSQIGSTQLHRLVIVFHGFERVVCEEVDSRIDALMPL
jgi:hypothetical protein